MFFAKFMNFIVKYLLKLRYRIKLIGFKEIKKIEGKGILFLPNHPGLIDPFIIYSVLLNRFKPRPLIDERQANRPVINSLVRGVNGLPIPDISKVGLSGKAKIEEAFDEIVNSLKRGENVLLYPSGQVYRQHLENLRGASGVTQILTRYPECRVVLIRHQGLWGSSFGYGQTGKEPLLGSILLKMIFTIFANLIFFVPKRKLELTFSEPNDFPRSTDKQINNTYMENFYNQGAKKNLFVPYHFLKGIKPVELPDPKMLILEGDLNLVLPEIKSKILEHLEKITGKKNIQPDQKLANDLGLDSIALADCVAWVSQEFGQNIENLEGLVLVKDLMLSASGVSIGLGQTEVKKPSAKWQEDSNVETAKIYEGENIAISFLNRAKKFPNQVCVADESSGEKTYRDLILAILVLKPFFEKVEGKNIGIMLPASVGSVILYYTALFANKTPVMLNWTMGSRNLLLAVQTADLKVIYTAKPLIQKLSSQGVHFDEINDRIKYLEDLRPQFTKMHKIGSLLKSKFNWSELYKSKIPDISVILFTSGSESAPKAVPLTHKNQMQNIKDVLSLVPLKNNDRFIAFLPPFHSFGITVTTIMTSLCGFKTVYTPNPTDAQRIAQLIDKYKTTCIPGTPTFLSGIVKAGQPEQLTSLRMAVTGAEKCSEATYELLANKCKNLSVLEGYGITECGPVVSVNPEIKPIAGSIGKLLPSLKRMYLDPETGKEVNGKGLLLVTGPSIFNGYLNSEVASPFKDLNGEHWYATGDLVEEDQDGYMYFKGRKKRFIKIAGEMISLPAIEEVLLKEFRDDSQEGPCLAIEATADETKPEVVLFTTIQSLDREKVNDVMKKSGLASINNVKRVIVVSEIPVLGTGKTDYRSLKDLLAKS